MTFEIGAALNLPNGTPIGVGGVIDMFSTAVAEFEFPEGVVPVSDPPEFFCPDSDADGVCDVDDNCVDVPNPRLGTREEPEALPFQTSTGGQLDDDGDGFGNACDAKFGNAGQVVGGVDIADLLASFNKDRSGDDCGTAGDENCAQFDLDNAGQFIGGSDVLLSFQLFNSEPGPKCDDCPLDCEGPRCP